MEAALLRMRASVELQWAKISKESSSQNLELLPYSNSACLNTCTWVCVCEVAGGRSTLVVRRVNLCAKCESERT